MELFGKKDIELLNDVAADLYISIYIPTHREGEAVNQEQDKLELKNSLQALDKDLSECDMKARDRKAFLKKANDLVEDKTFWRHQSDGLAIFITKDFFKYYELPLRFERRKVISTGFYLKPLMPMLTSDGRFFILALNKKLVAMYEGTRHSITEVSINDLVPQDMESALRYDDPEKQLQFKTGQGPMGAATFHGHGAGKDTTDERLDHFCRQIDKGLMKMLHDEEPPMVLIADQRMAAAYRSVNTYPKLLEDFVNQNPKGLDAVYIHELAWEKVEDHFNRSKNDAIHEYEELKHTEKTSNELEDILAASKIGRVGKLLLKSNGDGQDTPPSGKVNQAAIQTILSGGEVYFLDENNKPEDKDVFAVLRY